MNPYIYKSGGKTYMCVDNEDPEYHHLNGLMRAIKIGNHILAGEVVNGDEFEDGEELTDNGFEVKNTDEVPVILINILRGITPKVLIRRT